MQNQQHPFEEIRYNHELERLPNDNIILTLGIASLPGLFSYVIPGIIFSVIVLALSKKDKGLYKANPEKYMLSSYTKLKTGRIFSIITLLMFLSIVIYFIMDLRFGHHHFAFG